MSAVFLLIPLLLFQTHAGSLCSDVCAPNECSGVTDSTCTNCPTDWIYSSNTCSLDPNSGLQLVSKSVGMTSGTTDIQLTPSSSYTCGDYTLFGTQACSSNLQLTLSSGITVPHYQMQVIAWIFLYDTSTWTTTNNITLALGSTTTVISMANFDGQLSACNSLTQTYYRATAPFSHVNATGTSITIGIRTDVSDAGCTWGFKEVMILAKTCHSSCTQCSGSSSTACYSCISSKFLSGNQCAASCLTGYGTVTSSNVCVLCDSKCTACTQNSTHCSACQNSTNEAFLYQQTCVNPCPDTTFANSATHTCDACIQYCSICSDSSTCNTCLSGYKWYNQTCYSTCPSATFPDNNNCTLCDSYCTSCSVSSTNCSACVESGANLAYLYNSSSCQANCPTGTYSSTSPNVCNDCDPKCISCETTSTNCSSCTLSGANKAYLHNQQCLSSCPDGTYSSINPNICTACDPKCILCDTTSTNCSSCTLSGADKAYLYSTACVSTCPDGTFSSSSPNTCTACDPKCILCDTTSTNCSSCTLSGGNKAYLYNLECVGSCPTGTFSSDNPNVCTACDSKCIACDTSSTNCSSCTLSGANKAYLHYLQCLSTCPDGTFSSSNPNDCTACDSKCILCDTSSTNCSSCTLSGADKAYLYNSACVVSCPGGTFPTEAPNVCTGCHGKCSVCTGPSASECSSCSSGNVLSNTTCDAACLTQYGSSSTPSVCLYCSLSCTACYGAADNCSACTTSGSSESFLDSANPSYKKCLATCSSSSTFANTVNHQCDPCDANCLTCSGTAINCQSCNVGDGWLSYICYTNCPSTYFKDGANCTQCDSKCTACQGTATNCSVCTSSAYLLNNICYSICPNPYYGDNNGGVGPTLCLACDNKCASCTGPADTECQSCTAGNTLSEVTCRASCLTGYGPSPTVGLCVLCTSPCTGCDQTATNCVSCIISPTQHYLQTVSGSTTCVDPCPIGYYTDNPTLSCIQCPTGCYDCSSATNCYSCSATYLYYNSLCYNPCPVGTFPETATNCTVCYEYCTSCAVSSDNCSACNPNGTYRAFLLGNVCFPFCPTSYYGHTGTQTCKPCHAACLTCNGGSVGNCYICNQPYILSGNTCAMTCAANYGITTNPYVCVRCNNTCTACSYISTNCSACQSTGNFSAFLYNDNLTFEKCMMICPAGTLAVNSSRSCVACATGCATCNPTITTCLTCSAIYGLINSTCYSPCPSSYFLSGSVCSKCSPYCLECSTDNITCSSCVISGSFKSYFHNSQCVVNCPTGTYTFDNATLGPTTCNPCNSSCSDCNGDPNNCSSCYNNTFFFNNVCLTACPAGYFSDNAAKSCNDSSVHLKFSMAFLDNLNEQLAVDLDFTSDLDQATFPITIFQNITFSDPTITLGLFSVVYSWTSAHSCRILLTPHSSIYIYNVTTTVTTMAKPIFAHNSTSGVPFSPTVYSQTRNINWFLIKGSGWSNLQATIINSFATTSQSISSITTMPGMQEINKAGLSSIVFPGAQLSSSSILINSVPAQNSYEGARFWGNFVFFEVPGWQKNKKHSKNIVSSSADSLTKKSRLLDERKTFQLDEMYWRFNRTGFTTFFIYDCYMQMFIIAFSWVLILLSRFLENKVKQGTISKLYSLFHSLHQITIFYLALGLVLELLYFDITSTTRLVSLILCLCFNLYYLVYQLVVYYDLIKYPMLQIGSVQYHEIAKKYGYFLKNIRYEEYDDLDRWSPKHIFRPYNYHIVAFYKKYLMIFSVALFYQYPHYAAGTLVAIQLFELIRFCLSWPFASQKRNIIRLTLEVVVLVFFITVLLQTIYLHQIAENNMETIVPVTKAFYVVGWISFVCIFVFNLSFMCIFIHDICCYFTQSNSEAMRAIRKDFYYQKILKYQNCIDTVADTEMLDSWVVKGDLNENWVEDKEVIAQDIEVTVEKYTINKMGDGFTVQLQKNVELEMKHPNSIVSMQKIKVKEQIHGTIGLTKQVSYNFYLIVKAIFDEYDPLYHADFITLKTIAKIETRKYKSGDTVRLQDEPHVQALILQYPREERKMHKLAVPLKGFPVSPELFNPYIFSKTLNKKCLY